MLSVLNLTIFFLLSLGLTPLTVDAQGCAMCQTVLPQADEPIARGMFWCVLILLTAPFALGVSIGGWLFYQYRRAARSQNVTAAVLKLPTANFQGRERHGSSHS